MPDSLAIAQAKKSLSSLIASLSIGRVVCVDDYYGKQSVDALLPYLLDLSQGELQQTFELATTQFPEDKAIRREKIRQAWASAGEQVRQRATERFAPSDPRDVGPAGVLSEVIDNGKFLALSPNEWATRKAEIIAAVADQRILLLFDQEIAGGGHAAPTGISLIENALAEDKSGRMMCGLLTHTATLANYREKWAQHSQRPGIDKDRFLVVPKESLESDLQGFVRLFKLVALSPDCQKLRAAVSSLFKSATEDATKKMEGLSPFDLEHLVFKLSREEGLWEPDTLFRLFGIYHRGCLRGSAHNDPNLQAVVERIRCVSQVPVTAEHGEQERCTQTGAALQHLESYEPATYINELHLPLEVGDIFRKADESSPKHFIVLAQPCDLMVRAKGRRGVEEVLLAEIVKDADDRGYSEVLPHFGSNPSDIYRVLLKRSHMVSAIALDLCVFNDDGISQMMLPCVAPRGLCTAWQSRFELLQKQAKTIIADYSRFGGSLGGVKPELMAQIRATLAAELPPKSGNTNLFAGRVTLAPTITLAFNCKRVGRLERSRAVALAAAYANCLTRPGFDRDLGLPLAQSPIAKPSSDASAPPSCLAGTASARGAAFRVPVR